MRAEAGPLPCGGGERLGMVRGLRGGGGGQQRRRRPRAAKRLVADEASAPVPEMPALDVGSAGRPRTRRRRRPPPVAAWASAWLTMCADAACSASATTSAPRRESAAPWRRRAEGDAVDRAVSPRACAARTAPACPRCRCAVRRLRGLVRVRVVPRLLAQQPHARRLAPCSGASPLCARPRATCPARQPVRLAQHRRVVVVRDGAAAKRRAAEACSRVAVGPTPAGAPVHANGEPRRGSPRSSTWTRDSPGAEGRYVAVAAPSVPSGPWLTVMARSSGCVPSSTKPAGSTRCGRGREGVI